MSPRGERRPGRRPLRPGESPGRRDATMREITPETVVDHLRRLGRIPADRPARAEALGWGVSNVVIRVEVGGEPAFVVKQSRERLRTKAYWASRIERIWS